MVRSERIIVAAVGIAAMACGHERTAATPPQPPAQSSSTMPSATAAPPSALGGGPPAQGGAPSSDDRGLAIARAACAHVQRCGGIGPLGAFSSREECMAYLIETDIDPLGISVCPEIDSAALQQCLEALRSQDCEEASTPAQCLAPALCAPPR